MTGDAAELSGLKVLVVEDVLLVAEVISDGLEQGGCEIVGPVARLEPGLELARAAPLDGAVLDLNLAGRSSLPIAEALEDRGIPFFFVTGYDPWTALPPEYRSVPRLAKPFHISSLVRLAAQYFRA
jgi:CheY-like chemotaxis protein